MESANQFEDTEEVDGALQDDNEIAAKLGQRGVLSFDDEEPPTSPGRDDAVETEAESILSIPVDELKVIFEVIGTKIKQDKRGKFTAYSIIVMETPKLDTDKAIIERRYSDFSTLHTGLKKECPAAARGLPFPKKELFGNFKSDVLQTRSRKFEKYLRFVYHQNGVKDTASFKEFFFRQHLREAALCLRYEDYGECYSQYKLGLTLQKKLGDQTEEMIPTLCGLVEVCKAMKKHVEGESLATHALDLIGFDLSCPYLLPLIKTTIELRAALKIDSSWLSMKLSEVEQLSGLDCESYPSLRELAVKRF